VKAKFTPHAEEEYRYWEQTDRRVFNKINDLLRDIAERPFTGLGKPEPLRHELSGSWSRRITQEHRLVYRVESKTVVVISCRYHYGK
jgi:toxin YoeB